MIKRSELFVKYLSLLISLKIVSVLKTYLSMPGFKFLEKLGKKCGAIFLKHLRLCHGFCLIFPKIRKPTVFGFSLIWKLRYLKQLPSSAKPKRLLCWLGCLRQPYNHYWTIPTQNFLDPKFFGLQISTFHWLANNQYLAQGQKLTQLQKW